MNIGYAATRTALYSPGRAWNFFQLGNYRDEANAAAELARLAYVREKTQLALYLARAGFALLEAIGYERPGTQLFIAKGAIGGSEKLLISFRGTEHEDPTDMATDLSFLPGPWLDADGQPMGRVHRGFAEAICTPMASGTPILDHLQTVAAQRGLPVVLAGHSLGGALATLAASRIAASLYTFGSPRVGDATFAAAMQSVAHRRYVDCLDLVTRVPPRALGYAHCGDLHYIDRNGAIARYSNELDPAIVADREAAEEEYKSLHALINGKVAMRSFADHSPINYVSALLGIR